MGAILSGSFGIEELTRRLFGKRPVCPPDSSLDSVAQLPTGIDLGIRWQHEGQRFGRNVFIDKIAERFPAFAYLLWFDAPLVPSRNRYPENMISGRNRVWFLARILTTACVVSANFALDFHGFAG